KEGLPGLCPSLLRPRMSRHFFVIFALFLTTAPTAVGQPPRFRETAEPPLADEAGTVLTAAAREPRTLTPGVRWSDAPAPVVLLQVRAPAVLPVGQNVEVRLVVEN